MENYPKNMTTIVWSSIVCAALGGAYVGLTGATMVSLKGLYLTLGLISVFNAISQAFALVQPLLLKLRPSLFGCGVAIMVFGLSMAGLAVLFGLGFIQEKEFIIAYMALMIVSSPLGIYSVNLETELFSRTGLNQQWFRTYAHTAASAGTLAGSLAAAALGQFVEARTMVLIAVPLILAMKASWLPALIEYRRRRW